MTDHAELVTEIQNLRSDVVKLEGRVEAMNDTLAAELRPMIRLYLGNGKPSLEARLYLMESEVASQASQARWAIRTAVTGLVGALATIVWTVVQHMFSFHT